MPLILGSSSVIDDSLLWLTAMHRAAWAIVRAYEASGTGRPDKLEGAMRELSEARGMLLEEWMKAQCQNPR